MRLCDCAAGKLYMIRTVTAEETIVRRLEALGLVEGTKVHILMKKQDGSLIAAFQGTRLALGKKIAGAIQEIPTVERPRFLMRILAQGKKQPTGLALLWRCRRGA